MNSSPPTIIAKPYLLSQKHPRLTKDYQYFTVEYSLGTLCAIGYALIASKESLSFSKAYNIDYSKMSMGLWLSLLRSSHVLPLPSRSCGSHVTSEVENLG